MGLILKDKIPALMKGYPTMSDKYNVIGGILQGDTASPFGDILLYGDYTGYYKAPSGAIAAVTDIAGINLATNVKLLTDWANPNGVVEVKTGEALNLLLNGYCAVELDSTAVDTDIVANKAVAVLLATGKLTTTGVADATDLPGYKFTGIKELHGAVYYAEIVKE